jgi:hypothetical protein
VRRGSIAGWSPALCILDSMFRLAVVLGLSTLACTGKLHDPVVDDDGEDDDDDVVPCVPEQNQPPATPELVAPLAGLIDVLPGEVTIQTSAFSDADAGDVHEQSEFEIWLAAGGGPVLRVWSAAVDAGVDGFDKLTQVTLADGTFEVGDGALDALADYQVVARHRDSAECSAWSEWSAPQSFRTDDGSTYWFGRAGAAPSADTIREVRIELPQTSYDLINAQSQPPGCVPFLRDYYPGSVTLDGVRYDGAGVRTKGGCGSSRTLEGKAGLKVNLSWNDPAAGGCPPERRSHGLKRLTLNNLVQDRSFVHERLAYHFYQLMGVPTPRANHARVFVNDAFWGLYAHVETIDRRFLSRWFADNDGMLYEGTYFCDLVPANVPPADEDTFCISRKFRLSECEPPAAGGDPEDYTPIRAMVQELEALLAGPDMYPAVASIFDFDTFLSMWAVETIIGHWDGYTIEIVNNYRIYHDPSTDLWTFIPTGVDQTFDRNIAVGSAAGRLAQRCWAEEDCKAVFLARVAFAIDVFEQADLGTLAEELRAQIAPLVMEDDMTGRAEGSFDEFQSQVNATIEFIDRRPGEIRAGLPL